MGWGCGGMLCGCGGWCGNVVGCGEVISGWRSLVVVGFGEVLVGGAGLWWVG